MKPIWKIRPILLLAACCQLAAGFSAVAQGMLEMSTASANGLKPRIQLNGVNVSPNDNVLVELLVTGPGVTSLSGDAATPFRVNLSGSNAGLFSKGAVTVAGRFANESVTVTVRAWNVDTGATFDQATERDSVTFPLILGGFFPNPNVIPALPARIDVPGGFSGLRLGLSATPLTSVTALPTSNVRFITTASGGTLPISFKWFKNDQEISGATANSIVLRSIDHSDVGTYCVQVTSGTHAITQCATLSLLSPLLRPNLINLKLAFDPATQIVQGTTDLASGKWTDWSFIEPGVPIPIAEETARFIRIRPK